VGDAAQHPAVDPVAAPDQAAALGQLGRLVEGGAGRGQVAEVELEHPEGMAGLELKRPVAGGGGRPVGVPKQHAGRLDVAEAQLQDRHDHQRGRLVADAAGGPGYLQGLVAPAPGRLVVAGHHQRPGQPGRDPGPQRSRRDLGDQLDRPPGGGQHLRRDPGQFQLRLGVEQVAAQAVVGQGRPQRLGVLVDHLDGLGGEADGLAELAGVVGRLGRADQHLEPVDAGHGGGVGHPGPQLQGLGQVPEGLAGGEHRRGVVGRPDQRGQPAREVVAGQAVPGQLGRRGRGVVAVGVGLGQQAGVGGVKAGPLARQQVAVDRLLEQGVAEPVALVGR
jgi:hypothetical protein